MERNRRTEREEVLDTSWPLVLRLGVSSTVKSEEPGRLVHGGCRRFWQTVEPPDVEEEQN